MKRDWAAAIEKCQLEARCRACGRSDRKIDAAHVIGRSRDERRGSIVFVNPDSIIPLCTVCHGEYDAHRMDACGLLSVDEGVQAVRDAGGLGAAYRRVTGRRLDEGLAA